MIRPRSNVISRIFRVAELKEEVCGQTANISILHDDLEGKDA